MNGAHKLSSIIKGRSDKRPRLCLFTDSAEPSGMGEHIITLAAALKDEYRISFVCPPTSACAGFLARAKKLGLETLALAAPYDDKAALDALCRWLKARDFDIFHCHAGIGWEGFGGVEAARMADVPVVVRTEHLPYLLTHAVQQRDHRRISASVDRIICVSQAARTSYIEAGYSPRHVSLVYNGIPLKPLAYKDGKLTPNLGLPAATQAIITVGRLTEQKGYNILLKAVPTVLQQRPDVHFLWVGDGPLKDDLESEIERLGVGNNVHLLGRRDDVPALLAAAELFVLPSLFEGFPISALEAMAAALPIVGTGVCGISEAVIDGATGRLVSDRNPAALAEAMLDLLAYPARAARWGHNAQQLVREKFTAAHMAAATSAIYRELLVERRVPSAEYRAVSAEYRVPSAEA